MQALVLALVVAAGPTEPLPVDFDTDVVPVLTKAGCNAAACHGAAAGRGGFKLSLFGGDPKWDYRAIVHQYEGRRINWGAPEDSLLLAKPTGIVEHGGGVRLDYDGPQASLLARWVTEGARRLSSKQLVQLAVEPRQVVVDSVPKQVSLRVVASFDVNEPGGTLTTLQRDVTDQTVLTPDDPAAVSVDGSGRLTVKRSGRHTVVVRYLTEVDTVQLTAPLRAEKAVLAKSPRHNWIDDQVLAALDTLRLPPSEQADDAALLRRLTIDLTGRLPRPEAVREYLADSDPDKYAKQVEQLLQGDAFVELWTMRLAQWLRVRSQPQDQQGARAFHDWIAEQVRRDARWDQAARALITASGDSHEVGPANFFRLAVGPREQAEYVSEVILGVRLRCANCHNHPLDRWTQDDYHGLSAIFARVERGRVVKVVARGEVTHPRTGKPARPRIPGVRFLDPSPDASSGSTPETEDDPRKPLADWIASPDNPYFARAMVNRLWKAMMGRGLVEPTDDLRATNPASHPELLERLTAEFHRGETRLRPLLRTIALSAAYQRSSRATAENSSDDRFYAHALVKPLPPEVMADALADVTGVADRYGKQPVGTRAVTLFDPNIAAPSLDILGRCSRVDSCETDDGAAGGLSTRLHLINGTLINAKIAAERGRLHRRLKTEPQDAKIVEEFYLRALGRRPTARESDHWTRQFRGSDNQLQRRQRFEDFLWSLLNCREFRTNH